MRALRLRPRSALAIYAHPDDADVAAGGLMAQWASEGIDVHLVVICDGAKGSHSPHLESSIIRETRKEELESAADVLGARSVTSLDWPDGTVTNSLELRETLGRSGSIIEARGRARPRPDGDVLRRGLRQPP